MLSQIREKFAGGVALAILGVIGVSFIFFGANLNIGGNIFAAKVDGSEISVAQLENLYQSQLDRNPQLATLPSEFRIQLRQSVLDSLIRERLVELYLVETGYQVGEAQLTAAIQSQPEFQLDGEFDLDTAEALLAQFGMTNAQYRVTRRNQMRQEQLQRAIGGTALVTPAEYRRYLNLIAEQRLVSLAAFDMESAAAEVTVTPEAITAYYDGNETLYLLPEAATVEYIELNRSAIAASIEISEEVLNNHYLDSQNRYLQDEQRQARHILIAFGDDEDAAELVAQDLLARISAGESFADLAAEHSMDGGTATQGGDMGVLTRSQMPAELGSAVFTMAEGDVGGPVKSDFGFHIVRLDTIFEQGPLPLDQVRGELLSELRERETDSVFRELARTASDALFDNPDMQVIADAVGLEVQIAEDFQRSNAGPFGNNQAAIDAVFDERVLNGGDVSEVIELDVNRSAIFKVIAHDPASRQPLEDVRDQVEAAMRSEQAEVIVFDRASQLMQALDSGEQFGPAAEAAGAVVSAPTLISRQNTDIDQAVLTQVFLSRKPAQDAPVRGQVGNVDGGYTIFSLDAVLPGRPESIPLADRDAGKARLALQAGGADYVAFVQSLYEQADIVVNQEIVAATDLLQ